MKSAYAGGGEDFDPYYQQHVQQVYEDMAGDELYSEASMPSDDVAQDLVLTIGEAIGWWPLLGLIVVGAVFIFKKRIKKVLRDWIKE